MSDNVRKSAEYEIFMWQKMRKPKHKHNRLVNMKKMLLALLLGATAFAAQAETHAVIETNFGKIELRLDEQAAPKTVANFVEYAEKGFYNGTVFHRVIHDFMIQGGGFTADMLKKSTGKSIVNEADNGLKNVAGSIAMARTADPHSASSQFFINLKDNDFLDHKSKNPAEYGYAVFGKVVAGMDVVRQIGSVHTDTKMGYGDVPTQPVLIKQVRIVK